MQLFNAQAHATDRATDSSREEPSSQRAAPKPARASRETRRGLPAPRGLQGQPMYASDEGQP